MKNGGGRVVLSNCMASSTDDESKRPEAKRVNCCVATTIGGEEPWGVSSPQVPFLHCGPAFENQNEED